jgi:hypothetical protein
MEENVSQTIKEKGITADCSWNNPNIVFEIYIDGTKFYFIIDFSFIELQCSIVLSNSSDIHNQTVCDQLLDLNPGQGIDVIATYYQDFVLEKLMSWGVERRDANTIISITLGELYKKYK